MAEPTLSDKLAAHHVALKLKHIPEPILESAKLHVLDSLGCLIAGSLLEPGKLAYALAVTTSGTGSHVTATLFGTTQRVCYLGAVQAMSVAAHCGEMDDIHGGAGTQSPATKRRHVSGSRSMRQACLRAAGGQARSAERSA
jgi:2-methylcitrate dehydratase PrpD